jgi:hypothetical protein
VCGRGAGRDASKQIFVTQTELVFFGTWPQITTFQCKGEKYVTEKN